MTNNIRVFLWLALGLAIYVNFSQWQMDYAPKPVVPTATTTTLPDGTIIASKPRSMSDIVPQAGQSTASPDAAAVPQAAATAAPADSQPEVPADSTVHVKTDVLDLEISRIGGTLVKAVLPAYPVTKGQPDPVVLLNRNSLATNYVLQTGLTGPTSADRPTHLASFTSASNSYELAPGADELRVPLTWTDGKGVTVTKTYVFHRSMFVIGLEYQIANQSGSPRSSSRSMGPATTFRSCD